MMDRQKNIAKQRPADTLVCLRAPDEKPKFFFDDNYGTCARCGHRIRFRPHGAKIKRKICTEYLPAEVAGRSVLLTVTPEAAAEYRDYVAKRSTPQ